MTLSGVLAEFGIDAPCVVERSFTTPLGAPKAVVRIEGTGERLFIGSLIHSWPSLAHINAVFPLLNQVCHRLRAAGSSVAVGSYRRTRGGGFAVRQSMHHRFVRTHFGDMDAKPEGPHSHAHALADFHGHGALALGAASTPPIHTVCYAKVYPEWILPQLLPEPSPELARHAAAHAAAPAVIFRNASQQAALLDRLPVYLTHTDFQAKNVLVQRVGEQSRICIIDAEGAQLQSRLFDLYFMLMGDDLGSALDDLVSFRALLGAYFSNAAPLTADEALLLVFALQTKAAAVAAWAASEFDAAVPTLRTRLGMWYAQGLRCVLMLERERDSIRSLAETFRQRQLTTTAP